MELKAQMYVLGCDFGGFQHRCLSRLAHLRHVAWDLFGTGLSSIVLLHYEAAHCTLLSVAKPWL